MRQRGPAHANIVEKLWQFRYRRGARSEKLREFNLSLGPVRDVTLAQARERAAIARAALAAGQDPRQALGRARGSAGVSFAKVADGYLNNVCKGLRSEKSRVQWRLTLGDAYCHSLRSMPIDAIGVEHVV